MIPVRYDELFQAIRRKVNTQRLKTMLGANNRVFLEGEDYSEPEDGVNLAWGRLVIVPVAKLWPEVEVPGQLLKLGLLFRAEVNDFHRIGYSAAIALEALLDEVYLQLENWVPDSATYPMTYVRVAFPFFMSTPPQPRPVWDEKRRLFMLSTTYKVQVIAPSITAASAGGWVTYPPPAGGSSADDVAEDTALIHQIVDTETLDGGNF